jgi:ubiquinone/menaquinone biosynthesis C-methylase UbiE
MCGAPSTTFKTMGKRLNQSQGLTPSRKNGITTTVVKCGGCGLIFANPLPIPASIQDHYGMPPETYWKEDYFKVSEDYFKGEVEWLSRLIEITPGMKSLDIGAGLGKQMIALQKAGFDVYGLEPSEPFYERAIQKMGIEKDRLKLSSVEDAEYDENSFDFISFGVVLEHLYDPAGALQKALRWLKPGGLIHIEVPSANWLINKILNTTYKLRGSDYVANISPMHTPFHLYEFSLESFKKNAEKGNYKIKDHGYYVCQTFMPKVLDPLLKSYMRKTETGMQLCMWLEKLSS